MNSGRQDSDLLGESVTGLEPNIAGFLCYGLGWLTGVVFWVIEKEEQFVRFHAMQSIVVFSGMTVILMALLAMHWVPYVGIVFSILSIIAGLVTLSLWILLMFKAYQGERYKIPYAGDFAERFL